MTLTRERLDALYARLNRRRYVHPDPIEFLYRFPDPRDRELAGLVAAVLAYGRVRQILASVETALKPLGPTPRGFLDRATRHDLRAAYARFRHRVTAGHDLADLLWNAAEQLRAHGTLNAAFLAGYSPDHATVVPALRAWADRLSPDGGHLLPNPRLGSACKRPMLYLRWMVRADAVDPGGWNGVPTAKLVVPLDTHMAQVARASGLTTRATPGLKMALEITDRFRALNPDDPVKYDFALTRAGIRNEPDLAFAAPVTRRRPEPPSPPRSSADTPPGRRGSA